MFFRSSGGAFLSGGATDLSAAAVVSGIGAGEAACSEGFSAAGFAGDEVWALIATAEANARRVMSRDFMNVRLPNVYPLVRRSKHRRALGNIERLLELVEVRERNDRAEAARRMRVGIQAQLEILIALCVPPNLGKPEEEPLLGSEFIDRRRRHAPFGAIDRLADLFH